MYILYIIMNKIKLKSRRKNDTNETNSVLSCGFANKSKIISSGCKTW